MRLLPPVFLSFICWFETSCHLQKENRVTQDSAIHIKYSYKAEFANPTTATLIPIEGYTYLLYKDSKLAMRIPIPLLPLIRIETDSGTVFTDDGQLPIAINYDYALISLPDSSAIYYKKDSLAKAGIKINGDSMYRKRIPPLPNIIDAQVDSLIEVREVDGLREEVYIVKNKPDDSYPDSTIISFSKHLNHVPFTFSSVLDKNRGMKLYRIRFVTKSAFNSTVNKLIPQRELVCEFKLINPPIDKFLRHLFK